MFSTPERKLTEDYEVWTSNGWKSFHGIRKTRKDSLRICFNDGTNIECSRSHKFYENERFIHAYEVIPGDMLSGKRVVDVQWAGEQDLYDLLEVEDGHHYTASDVEVSNCAFIAKNKWDDFFKSTFPTISSGSSTKLMIVSTPNGRNHMYDMWTKAKAGLSNMYPVEVNWWDVPGRDEKWHQEMLKTMTEEQFEIEYGNNFDIDENSLISTSLLKRLETKLQKPIESSMTVKVYEKPVAGHSYVCSVDVSAGIGKDYSVATIMDVTTDVFFISAIFASNKIDYYAFPSMIVSMASKYNNAEVLVESNDLGHVVLHMLNYDLEYDNIFKTYKEGGVNTRPTLGQRTTTKTKIIGCNTLKDMCTTGKLVIPDQETLSELGHFQRHGDSFEAIPGYHDDRIMTLVNFCYYSTTNEFARKYDRSVTSEMSELSAKAIEESLAPIPLFSGNNWGDDTRENLSWLR